jgi:site-specific recombinase XerD
MSTPAPLITIFVRHSADCKYQGDEFCKRCNCRKHFRWTQNGIQQRRKAGTRSWVEAEEAKRRLEDEFAGRAPVASDEVQPLDTAVTVFLQDKNNQGVSPNVLGKYTRELARLKEFCAARSVHTVRGLSRELLTAYCGTWADVYPSSLTRSKVRERLRTFLRYCFQAEWINRVPVLSKIQVDQIPTLPLTADEYDKLLKATRQFFPDPKKQTRVHALLQLMRWSGLAIRDALTIKRTQIFQEAGLWRVVTARQKTGTHVSVPLPPAVAKELVRVCNGNPVYVFWTGKGLEETATKHWAKDIAKVFEASKIEKVGYMTSHRLRDTFAVDLLEKGVPLEEVSKLLGHESIKTTESSYAKWVKGRQDRLDKLVTATWKK